MVNVTTEATKPTANPTSEHLTWEKLVAMRDRIPKPSYTFRVPKLDQDLDIRDYELREVEGMYLLRRKEDIFGPAEFSMMSYANYHPLAMHPAHLILLKGATPKLAQQLLDLFPELRPK